MADTLIDRVAESITRYNMLPRGARVGVAVSGGADSVVLLHIFYRLAPALELDLSVLHVNHGLRGAESDGDEQFVRELAASLDLPSFVTRPTPSSVADLQTAGNLEAAARAERRAFFAECRARHDLDRIALGHTSSDQAETVLHRLLRGTGLTGIAAMRPVAQEGLVRPLLSINREEIRAWARTEKLGWREDSSNTSLRFTRNRLRIETLPALTSAYNPNLEAALASAALLAQAEEDYWSAETVRLQGMLVRPHRLGVTLEIPDLQSLHLAAQRRLIRGLLAELRPNRLNGLDHEHIEAILAICASTAGHDRTVVPGADAMRSFETLLVSPAGSLAADERHYRLELALGTPVELPFGGGRICVTFITHKCKFCDNFKEVQELGIQRVRLNCQAGENQTFWVRNWEPGDELHRPGHRSPEKVKQLFQEFRVRLWERRHWPVVLSEDRIVWVREFGVNNQFVPVNPDGADVELEFRPPSRQP